ncbi:hypothetical protein ACS60R_01705 [Streptococcus suis]|uniref:Lignostilbene-alpha,beta-dioxygenase n=1 Tax=Streptococcus suis TaxID=1307 RepID=A0A123SW15_STRSU|nr:hypothetical protein [Streptococcus suis]MCK3848276.1 hypothetical protein [Streptococcus suis]MCK3959935.1 hypothetical protein [Streptococcus suis]MCK4065123.1 hypothetical protein [Streptococcus suis]MDW8709089.1 hypothetical protein [Streptococcus suis]NQH94575.1 hypothetical protein [Streptococcus suis]
MTETQVKLGYFESICQVLALETEDLTVEHPSIWKLIQTADEATFYQLAPHLFLTRDRTEPLLAYPLEATKEEYERFRRLLKGG